MPTLQEALSKLNQPAARTPTMPFGLHKGKPLEDLPNDYLLWLGCLDDLRQPLLGAVLREMGRRLAARTEVEGARTPIMTEPMPDTF